MTKDKENLYELKVALCNLVTIAENAVGKEEFEKLDNAGADIIDCLAELEKYRAIETVEELQELKKLITDFPLDCGSTVSDVKEIYHQLTKYLKIGTIEEFKALKEKSEQELLLELPCRVGDKVYKYHEEKGAVLEYTVWNIHISAYESGGVEIVIDGVAEDEEEWEDDFSLSLQEFKTQFSSTKGQALAEINI